MVEEVGPVYPKGRPQVLLGLFILVLAISAVSCESKVDATGPSVSGATNADVTVVPVATVGRSNLASNLVLTGEFIPYQEIDVMAKEAGYIKSIRVDIGDRVKTGQLLAELEIPEMQDDMERAAANVQASEADIATAQGNLTRAQSSHDIAQLSYKRVLDVSKKEAGLIPQQEVDVAHSRELETGAQVVAAQANLQTAQRKLTMAKAEQNRYGTLQKYTIISGAFCRHCDEAVCQYRRHDPARNCVRHAGNAGCSALPERSAALDCSCSRIRRRRHTSRIVRGRYRCDYWTHIPGPRDAVRRQACAQHTHFEYRDRRSQP